MKILCVCHNVPYPPNKGDKMRAYHLLRGLASEHEVHLLALAKDPKDIQYKDALEEWCESVNIVALNPLMSKIYALCCVFFLLPLTIGFFYSFRLKKQIAKLTEKYRFDATLSFCSSVAHYTRGVAAQYRLVDFIDVDSEKWNQYSKIHSFPKSLIYSYEYRRLRAVEKKIHLGTTLSLVTSDIEAQRLAEVSGENGSRIIVIPQGVALEFYQQPQSQEVKKRLVFTGQMDYLPNIDAVVYFHNEILPQIKSKDPEIEFYVVGRNPSEELRACCPNAVITGEVEDIRAYLHSASVVVAPLRLAFGMQSKILEAMASCLPVVASSNAAQSLWAKQGVHLQIANTVDEFVDTVVELCADASLRKEISIRGRQYVQQHHDWNVLVEQFLNLLRVDENQTLGEPVKNLALSTDGYEQVV